MPNLRKPRTFIPSKYTLYTVYALALCVNAVDFFKVAVNSLLMNIHDFLIMIFVKL